jgi:hypothetical protein
MERMAVLFRSNSGATPNPVKGFYTALAMFLPLLILTMLGQHAFGVLVMTGALLTSFGDLGTSSRTQAWSLGMTAVGGALMTALGRLIGGPWWVEVVEIFLVVFIGGLLSVYGRALAVMGLLLTIPFVSSLANRSGPVTANPRREALQNVVAAYLGALLAGVVIAGVQNALVLELIVVTITFLAFTIKDLNHFL